jgi:hypothetical protein
MINKENEYNKGIFNLLNEDFEQTTDDKIILNLIKELFLTDVNDINNEDIIKKLLEEVGNDKSEEINTKANESKQIITNEDSSKPFKSLLFTEVNYINNEE